MTEQNLKNSVLVDDYVNGSLQGEDLECFEERLLWDDALVEEVRLAEALRSGLRQHGANAGSPQHSQRSGWRWLPGYAVAATLLLAVSFSFNLVQRVGITPDPSGPPAGGTSPQVVRLLATRSSDLREITIDRERTVVLMTELIGGFDEYRLTLSNDAVPDRPLAVQSGQRSTQGEPPAIALPGAALIPGEYRLIVEARQAADADYRLMGEYRFRATAVTPQSDSE